MDDRIDLNAVAVFVRIVKSGSLSAAARFLKMPKTTVSKRLALLEQSLGVALITRTTRKLHVTDAGRAYFEHCQLAMRGLEQARVEVSSSRDHPSGKLKIAAPVDIAHCVLPKVIDAFVARHPGVTVDLRVSNTVVDFLDEGIDFAVRAGPMRDSSFVGRPFIELTTNVYASPDYLRRNKGALRPQDLSSTDFIAFGEVRHVELVRGRSTMKVDVHPKVVVDDLETVKRLIAIGTGVGWLPDFLAHADAARLVPAVPTWRAKPVGQVHFLSANPKHPSASVRAFVALAIEMLPSIVRGEGYR